MQESTAIPSVRVNDRGIARLRAGHVWVYASDVLDKSEAKPGSLVHVVGPKEQILGSAIYSSTSQIQLRLLCRDPLGSEDELAQLIRRRLAQAVDYRSRVVHDSNAYRLVFSEADGLPGLVVDRYHDVFALQVLAQAWDHPDRKQLIVEAIRELACAEHIVERADARIRQIEQLPPLDSNFLHGTKSATVFEINRGELNHQGSGVAFHYDAFTGQKTGAFLDQRENYAAAAAYAGGRALDVCTYQGGFALHLARVCDQVTALDLSRDALEVAEQNESLNRSANRNPIEWIEANAFDLLKDYAIAGRRYDAIVLDPPAFAKSKRNLRAALRGYKELNLRALRMLRPGGVLVTCCCSFAVSEEEFLSTLVSAVQDTHRTAKIIEKRGQSKDHPSILGVPETQYLKCVIAFVL